MKMKQKLSQGTLKIASKLPWIRGEEWSMSLPHHSQEEPVLQTPWTSSFLEL